MTDRDYIDEPTEDAVDEVVDLLLSRLGATLDPRVRDIERNLADRLDATHRVVVGIEKVSRQLSDQTPGVTEDLRRLLQMARQLQKSAADAAEATARLEAQLVKDGEETRVVIKRLDTISDEVDVKAEKLASELDTLGRGLSALEVQGDTVTDSLRRVDQRINKLDETLGRLWVMTRWLAFAVGSTAAVWLTMTLLFR